MKPGTLRCGGDIKNILGKRSSDIYPTIEDPASKKLIYKNEEKANIFNEFFLSHNNIDLSNARLPSDTFGNLADDIFIDHNY